MAARRLPLTKTARRVRASNPPISPIVPTLTNLKTVSLNLNPQIQKPCRKKMSTEAASLNLSQREWPAQKNEVGSLRTGASVTGLYRCVLAFFSRIFRNLLKSGHHKNATALVTVKVHLGKLARQQIHQLANQTRLRMAQRAFAQV